MAENKKPEKPNLWERTVNVVSPKRAQEAFEKRLKRQTGSGGKKDGAGGAKMAATGYGNSGASTTLNSLIGWIVSGGSAEDDIDLHGALLRKRARDLYAGGGLGRSGPATLSTSVVGWGIQPKPKIDGEALQMSDEACDEWERTALKEFRLWAESKMCDAQRQQTFYEMQQLAFLSMLISGDVFVLFGMKENSRTPYQTTLRLIEADRVSTPDGELGESESKELDGGGRIVDGVEMDAEGVVVRYHIASRHPLLENATADVTWQAIDAIGKDTGEPNILHIMTQERPEQRRGVPFVAAQIELLKQLDRYVKSELAASVVSSMLAVFITCDEDDGNLGIQDAVNEDEKVTDDEMKLELAPGAVYALPPGKKVTEVNPIRATSGLDSFVTTMETLVGAGLEIPKEVLIKKYDSNYTAARSALLDFWKTVRVYRTRFNAQFNQPVYEMWLAEAVAQGRVEAPGFFDDPAIRQAWSGCMWTGVSMGHVDPLKEVKAAAERINNNISTQEQEASAYDGGDWSAIVRQRRRENAELVRENVPENGQAGGNGGTNDEK